MPKQPIFHDIYTPDGDNGRESLTFPVRLPSGLVAMIERPATEEVMNFLSDVEGIDLRENAKRSNLAAASSPMGNTTRADIAAQPIDAEIARLNELAAAADLRAEHYRRNARTADSLAAGAREARNGEIAEPGAKGAAAAEVAMTGAAMIDAHRAQRAIDEARTIRNTIRELQIKRRDLYQTRR